MWTVVFWCCTAELYQGLQCQVSIPSLEGQQCAAEGPCPSDSDLTPHSLPCPSLRRPKGATPCHLLSLEGSFVGMEAFWLHQRSAFSPEESGRAGKRRIDLFGVWARTISNLGLGNSSMNRTRLCAGVPRWQLSSSLSYPAALRHDPPRERTNLGAPEDEEQMCSWPST